MYSLFLNLNFTAYSGKPKTCYKKLEKISRKTASGHTGGNDQNLNIYLVGFSFGLTFPNDI